MAREDFDVFEKNAANYVPLTPLSFIRRAAEAHGGHPSVIHGTRRYTWAETYARCVRLASALSGRGIGRNDVVSFIAPNIPEMVEAHFGVNMSGAVLNTINTRLDADTIAYIIGHAESKLVFCDTQYSPVLKEALALLGENAPAVIDIVDDQAELKPGEGERCGDFTYEEFIASGNPAWDWPMPADEWDAMAINYTSGTTGRPKGVVYHHRGAYLIAAGTIMGWPLPKHPKYVYVVPLFHCNGWGHAWAMAAQAGTIVCTRAITAKALYDAFADHGAQYFGGAPIVLQMLLNAKPEERREIDHRIEAFTAGAPPPPAVLQKMEQLGVHVQHVYGLTETYGHVTQCDWKPEWDSLPEEERAEIKGRQGPRMGMFEGADARDQETGAPIPHDGEAVGEIVLRGNTVMKGYFKNPEATAEAFRGGWFWSGDAAAVYPGGYLKIRDRLKDVIISGGENVSSVEVEAVIHRYPGVMAAGVVARPDETWGETPCAFVEMSDGASATAEEIIAFCRQHLAGFKTPKTVIFQELPKTSTGKIQKFVLREAAKHLDAEQGAGMAEFSEFAEFERQGWRDAATAASYASRFARAAAQVAPELVRAVDAGPGTKALDLCCGHGVVARALADAGAQVTGVDFSPAMLEIARAAVPEAGFQEGDAMAPGFGDGVFDAVTIGFGIPHVPDPAVVLAQVARVLVPGGRVAFSVWHGPEVPGILSVMACAIATHGDAEAVLPPGPGAHDFAVPERAFPVLEAAGFVEPEFHTVSSFWLVDDPAAPLEYCRDGAVRYGVMLKKQSPHALSLIAEDVRAYVRGLGDAAPWQVPIPAAVVTACKPG